MWLVLLLAATVSGILSCWSWASRAKIPMIKVGRDSSDITTLAGSQTLSSYDAYFNRVNFFERIDAQGPNVLSARNKTK